MVLTMQAHTPYTKDKYDAYDINVTKSSFNESMNDALRSYAQGIYDTDRQLNRLYEYIQTLDEPTVIVFYGDHLPQIADRYGTGMLDCFDCFNTDDELLNLYRKYNTQGLILANFEIEQPDYRYASPDLLSAYLLNYMDIQLSDYYRWLYSNLDVLPAMNKYIACDTDGNIYALSDMPDKLTKQYQLRNAMQYYYFVNEYQR